MSVLQENIGWNMRQASLFYRDAEDVPTKDRSRYYKASSLFVASVIEAMVFVIVKDFCDTHPESMAKQSLYSYQPLYRLPSRLLKDGAGSIVLYEERKKDFTWKGIVDFQALNRMGLRCGLFNKGLYNTLEKVRERRNRVHLQSLQEKHHRFTRRDVDYMFSAFEKLDGLLPNRY